MSSENVAAEPLASQLGYATNAGITLPTPTFTASTNGCTSFCCSSATGASTTGTPSCESVVVRPFGQPADLLAGPALEIGAEQQPPAGSAAEIARQRGHSRARAAEQNEPADTRGERLRDFRPLRPKRSAPPANRRTNQSSTRR